MKHIIIAILLMLATGVQAQTEPEYRLEIGEGIGMVSYQGDFNSSLFKDSQPMFSLLAKYKFNPRVAAAMNISYGQLKGSTKDIKSHIPQEWEGYSFTSKLWDVGFRMEYNFLPYGTGMEDRGAQRLTPYILFG